MGYYAVVVSSELRGALVSQSVERLTFDFGSGHDLTVCGFKPWVRLCADSADPAWDSLSLSLCPSCVLSLSLSLSLKTNLKKKKKTHAHQSGLVDRACDS